MLKTITILLVSLNVASGEGPRIITSKGTVEGLNYHTTNGNEANLYLGIPYAEAPEYELRYKKPVPRKSWPGVLNCTYYKDACPQTAMNTAVITKYTFSDDCLHVNVFAGMDCTPTTPCPVWNYIFGGANMFDSPAMLPWEQLVDNFASRGLVVVTTNFRLDSYAWFSTETDEALGNWAIHDQIQGLSWIQNEISRFGGDPSKVTIQGHSSGAQAVTLMSLSPKVSPDLFHQVVPMSGMGLTSAGISSQLTHSRGFALSAGCATVNQWDSGDFSPILKCLRSKSFAELNQAQKANSAAGNGFSGPSRDGPNGLFPTDVRTMASKRRPYKQLIGYVNHEQDLYLVGIGSIIQFPQSTVTSICASVLNSRGFVHVKELSGDCAAAFSTPGSSVAEVAAKILDSAMFMPGLDDVKTMQNAGAQVYLYSFEKPKLTGILADIPTPYHAMDLAYIFGLYGFLFAPRDSTDREMEKLYPQLFANFAKYSNPTPVGKVGPQFDMWKSVASGATNYYQINLPRFVNKAAFHAEEDNLWNIVLINEDKQISSFEAQSFDQENTILKTLRESILALTQFKLKSLNSNPYLGSFIASNLQAINARNENYTGTIISLVIGATFLALVVAGILVYAHKKRILEYEKL